MKLARNGASISSCRPTEPQKRSLVDISSLCFHSCIPSSEPFLWFEWCAAVPSVCQDDELLGGGQGGQRNRVNRVKNGLPMSSQQANAKKEKEIHSIWFAEFWRCHSVLVHGVLLKKHVFSMFSLLKKQRGQFRLLKKFGSLHMAVGGSGRGSGSIGLVNCMYSHVFDLHFWRHKMFETTCQHVFVLSLWCLFFGFARWTLRELFEILRNLEARIRYSAKTAIGFIRFPLG